MYKGELISLAVAVSWTICAMFAEVASKRLGSLVLNTLRMALSLVLLIAVMIIFTGHPYPVAADGATWCWLLLSGLVGYVIGDFCLFNCYVLIGSRYGQLLMTLAPPAAALAGWLILSESMAWSALLGMTLTVSGIGLSIYRPKSEEQDVIKGGKLPVKGILLGVCAGLCQGVGLVLSAKGLDCYEASIERHGLDYQELQNIIPFASTSIRAVMGLIGFTIWSAATGKLKDVRVAVHDRKGMLLTLGATLTGPFIGVSLSLMATLYTSAGIAQTIMALTPVLILLPTFLIFHQKITAREILGAIVAVAGVSLFFL